MRNLSAMIRRMVDGGVEFVLVGGYAAVAHGVSLVTQDVDICCRFTKENLFCLQRALTGLNPRHRMTPQKPSLELDDELCGRLKNLYLETDLGVIDCLSEVSGVGGFDDVRMRSIELVTPDATFRVLDIDALIRAKQAMNRPHDQFTVTQLKAIKERIDQGRGSTRE